MKKERILSLFLILILCVSLTPSARAADDFEVDARAALLIDIGTGETLYGKAVHDANPDMDAYNRQKTYESLQWLKDYITIK